MISQPLNILKTKFGIQGVVFVDVDLQTYAEQGLSRFQEG